MDIKKIGPKKKREDHIKIIPTHIKIIPTPTTRGPGPTIIGL